MILKKPYAFLIKNFKLIHAILTILYVYLAFKVSSILNYYNAYISKELGKINAIDYISKIPYVVIIISMVICTILWILMRYKKKPKLLYLILNLIYILVFALLVVVNHGLSTIYSSVLATKTILLYRDLLKIIILVQYATIALTTIRAIGFDIKKFNFKEDLNDLNIELTDEEEVELVMGLNEHKLTQKYNRKIRELKYYYYENKAFILIVIAIFIVIGLSTITIDKKVVNKVYKEQEVFSTDIFDMSVLSSYISSNSYKGESISDTISFVIVKLNINPKSSDQTFNTGNIILNINNNNYKLSKKYYSYFTDIGNGYKSQIIKQQTTYLFIFPIENNLKEEEMILRYTGSTKDINVKLEPINLDDNPKEKEISLGEEIDFSNTVLNSTSFKINNYEVKNKYTYNYTYMIDDKEYEGKKNIYSASNTILYLNITSSYSINTNDYDFINNYAKIYYKVNDTIIENKILNNKTPGSYKQSIYLEVDKEIENAESIYILFNIRNTTYKYILK